MNELEKFLSERGAQPGDFLVTDKGEWRYRNRNWLRGISPNLMDSLAYIPEDVERIGTPVALYRPDWERGIAPLYQVGNPLLVFTELKPKERGMGATITRLDLQANEIDEVTINGVRFRRCE